MTDSAIERAFRDEWARVVAALARWSRDIDLAEECAQEAFTAAAQTWPRDGEPRNAGSWLIRVAQRKALDRLRRTTQQEQLHDDTAFSEMTMDDDLTRTDERLRLMLMCAHPALSVDARIALTLRCVAGLSTGEIAAAFVVPEATLAQRIVRAKRKIRSANISFDIDPSHVAERVHSVRTVIYLLFNEGYFSNVAGAPVRPELAGEAVYLARMLYQLDPRDAENAGLLALLLLHHARLAARFDDAHRAIPLAEQDPALYDAAAIDEALHVLHAAMTQRTVGRFQLEAAISALHVAGVRAGVTDWRQIAALYERLAHVAPSPVVEINRAVAVASAYGAHAGLDILGPVLASGVLDGYAPFHVAHADILERAGETDRARSAWQRALEHATNVAEREEIERRLERLAGSR